MICFNEQHAWAKTGPESRRNSIRGIVLVNDYVCDKCEAHAEVVESYKRVKFPKFKDLMGMFSSSPEVLPVPDLVYEDGFQLVRTDTTVSYFDEWGQEQRNTVTTTSEGGK